MKSYRLALLACACLTAPVMARAATETVLYNFQGGADGLHPTTQVVLDAAGNVYGTTIQGGMSGRNCVSGCGVAYQVTPGGVETPIHTFGAVGDGFSPKGSLVIDGSGNLYGTTASGGPFNGQGTVFMLTLNQGAWVESYIHTFHGSDGASPQEGVTLDSAGNFFGTTVGGGASSKGTVFEIGSASTSYAYNLLHSFVPNSGPQIIQSRVVVQPNGQVFGLASSSNNKAGLVHPGVAYEINPVSTTGKPWFERIIFTFDAVQNELAYGPMTPDTAGDLYANSQDGGATNNGFVYALVPPAAGSVKPWTQQVLYQFGGMPDGSLPLGKLVLDASGNIFGTTASGGAFNEGSVFELSPDGSGGYTEQVLYSFTGGADGFQPVGVVEDSSGNLYGSTYGGGSANAGVVFKITP